MRNSVSLLFGALALCLANHAIAQEKFVPSTISQEAAAVIKEVSPGKAAPNSAEEWQAAWKENEETSKSANDEALKKYPAKIEKLAIAGVIGPHRVVQVEC